MIILSVDLCQSGTAVVFCSCLDEARACAFLRHLVCDAFPVGGFGGRVTPGGSAALPGVLRGFTQPPFLLMQRQ